VPGRGYVSRSAAREERLEAVQRAINGRPYITPSISDYRERLRDPGREAAAIRPTDRERDTLRLIAEGRSEKEAAHILDISAKTVSFSSHAQAKARPEIKCGIN
jgi:DNA-binding NarL/FixJ family response regulator